MARKADRNRQKTRDTDENSSADEPADAMRLDKWLWVTRFFKTRQLATKLCEKGKVRVNGDRINKPHRLVRTGDILTFPQASDIRVVRVEGFSDKRVGPPVARTLYHDMNAQDRTPDDEDPDDDFDPIDGDE